MPTLDTNEPTTSTHNKYNCQKIKPLSDRNKVHEERKQKEEKNTAV